MPVVSSTEPHILHTAKGVGFLTSGSLITQAIRFVTTVLLARALGAEGMGLYALGLTTVSLCSSLSALGLDDAMVRYLAIQRRRLDEAALAGTLQIGVGVSVLVGTVVGAGLVALAEPVASGIFDDPSLAPVLRAFGVVAPFLTLSNALLGASRGFKRMDAHALEVVLESLVRLILVAVLSLIGFDAVAAAVVFGIGTLVGSAVLLTVLGRVAPLRAVFRRGARRDVRGLVGFAGPLWLAGALRKTRQNIETLLLGTLTAVSSVGVFAVAAKVNVVGSAAYTAVITSVKPHLAELHGDQDRAGLEHLYRTTTRWTLLFGLPFVLVIVLHADPLLRVFGASFAAGRTALVVLAVGELVNAATGVCGSVLDMARRTGAKLVNSVLWLVLAIGLNVLLIPRWGVAGAAAASVIAASLVNVLRVIQVWLLERVQPYDRTSLKPVVAGAGALGLGLGLSRLWPAEGLPMVAAHSTAMVTAYGLLVVLLGVAPEDRLVTGRLWRRCRRLGEARVNSLRPGRAR